VATLKGANTGIDAPLGIAFGASGELFVANQLLNAVTSYAANATGNVAPIDSIAGAATGLNHPAYLAIH
jgi:hypothetical protein